VRSAGDSRLAGRSRLDELLAGSVTGFAYVAPGQMIAVTKASVNAERHITGDATEDLKLGRFDPADAGQMHLYLNYAKEHWMHDGENPPVGVILCAQKGEAVAHYTLEGLANKVLAREYMTVLPSEKLLAQEIEKVRKELNEREDRSKR
jgi:hypothetical protein